MTAKEFRKLHEIPLDIEKRSVRIAKLEAMQADGALSVSDVVKTSTGEGNACILGHTVVHGSDESYAQRDRTIRTLRAINAQKQALYEEGCRLIEGCEDMRLRIALTSYCLEGMKYDEIAQQMEENGIHVDIDALRKSVDRWIQRNVQKNF